MLGGGSDGLDRVLRAIGADRVQQKSDTGEQGASSPRLITCHFPDCPLGWKDLEPAPRLQKP